MVNVHSVKTISVLGWKWFVPIVKGQLEVYQLGHMFSQLYHGIKHQPQNQLLDTKTTLRL